MADREYGLTAGPDAVTAWAVRLGRGRRISGSAFRAGGFALRVPRRPHAAAASAAGSAAGKDVDRADRTPDRVPAQRTARVSEDRGAP